MSKAPLKNIWGQLNNSRLVRYLLLMAIGWGLVQVLAYFETLVVIFTFAAILAFLLNYPVRWLEQFMPRPIAIILVFLLSLTLLGGFIVTIGFTLLSQGQQLFDQLPEIVDDLLSLEDHLETVLSRWNLNIDFNAMTEQLRGRALSAIGIGLGILPQMLTHIVDLILIAVIAFFMLLDGAKLWSLVLKLFPNHLHNPITTAIEHNFLGFFWGRLLLSAFFGISAFVVFLLLPIPYALALAAIAGIFDLIPGIGATIGIILVSLIILPQGIWLSLVVIVSCIALQQIEENLLMPRIMQGSLDLNPVVMFFALLVGARIAGLMGIFLAIPIAGVIISLFDIEEMKGKS